TATRIPTRRTPRSSHDLPSHLVSPPPHAGACRSRCRALPRVDRGYGRRAGVEGAGAGTATRSPPLVCPGVAEYTCRGCGEGVPGPHRRASASRVPAPAETAVHVDALLLRQHRRPREPGTHAARPRRADGKMIDRRADGKMIVSE